MAGFDQQQQVHSPKFCTNGCGFYGAAATLNLCSKCYRHYQTEEAPTAYLKLRVKNNLEDKHLNDLDDDAMVRHNPNRCSCCNKRVGLTGYKCRCGRSFCLVHRYPEEHCCMFDFKSVGREAIAGANPLVKADKLQRI